MNSLLPGSAESKSSSAGSDSSPRRGSAARCAARWRARACLCGGAVHALRAVQAPPPPARWGRGGFRQASRRALRRASSAASGSSSASGASAPQQQSATSRAARARATRRAKTACACAPASKWAWLRLCAQRTAWMDLLEAPGVNRRPLRPERRRGVHGLNLHPLRLRTGCGRITSSHKTSARGRTFNRMQVQAQPSVQAAADALPARSPVEARPTEKGGRGHLYACPRVQHVRRRAQPRLERVRLGGERRHRVRRGRETPQLLQAAREFLRRPPALAGYGALRRAAHAFPPAFGGAEGWMGAVTVLRDYARRAAWVRTPPLPGGSARGKAPAVCGQRTPGRRRPRGAPCSLRARKGGTTSAWRRCARAARHLPTTQLSPSYQLRSDNRYGD